MQQLYRLWPIVIILSALSAIIVTFVVPSTPIRPFIVIWFLCVCPGMAFIRFLCLREAVVEWSLAIALSISLDAIIAAIFLYAKIWSPSMIYTLLIIIALCGAGVQLILGTGRSQSKA